MLRTDPDQGHPSPAQPAEQIDRLILDLHHALDRKRIAHARPSTRAPDQKQPPADRAPKAEAPWQQAHARNRWLCQALQDIVALSESDNADAACILQIGRLARAALAQAQRAAA